MIFKVYNAKIFKRLLKIKKYPLDLEIALWIKKLYNLSLDIIINSLSTILIFSLNSP